MATKLIKIPLIFLSSLIGCLLSSHVTFLILKSLRVFMINNKFISACVIFQYILSLFILGGEFLFDTNIAVFLVGSTLPCLVPVLFHTTIFLCGQYFYTDFKRYNLFSFLFTLSYFFAVVFLLFVIVWLGNTMYASLSVIPDAFHSLPLPPEDFSEFGAIIFSKVTTTDLTLSHLIITDNSAKTIIYFDSFLQKCVLSTWPEGFPKKFISYFINNLVIEIFMFKK